MSGFNGNHVRHSQVATRATRRPRRAKLHLNARPKPRRAHFRAKRKLDHFLKLCSPVFICLSTPHSRAEAPRRRMVTFTRIPYGRKPLAARAGQDRIIYASLIAVGNVDRRLVILL
jgi:hypothetical protein